ncbi:MAG TPA: hypothetical protein VGG94_07725 [Chthoniobacterales bacterium]|jgi:hypothetical protein
MDEKLTQRTAETAAHLRLKRLAFLWAQGQGYTACALEVSLPQCRYRADVAAYRPGGNTATAVFECKQARPDLRRDNCCTPATRERLDTVHRRRQVLEKHLRIHYPALRLADSLFPEFDSHNFAAIEHRNYRRVLRELNALHNRLYACAKFETLVKYRCANLFFLVLPEELYHEPEIPVGWGALVETDRNLCLRKRPAWHDTSGERSLQFLQRIARGATRALNRQLQITVEEVALERSRSLPPAL